MTKFFTIKHLKIFPFLFLILLINIPVFAQGSGTIRGTVFDKQAKEPLYGANVVVKNTSLGSSSNLDGEFEINYVTAGEIELVISYIGYRAQTISITVAEDKITELEVELDAEVVEGQVVLVTAQAKGQRAAINEQLSSNKIINVVSAEKMQELPDANLAESIGRLPGISLQRSSGEAEKVVIRGLSPKFNKVTVEGIAMTSTNEYDRSIDLSMIQGEMLSGVEVSKTLRANMDADAIGGTINLRLREAEEDLHFNARIDGGYNDLNSSWKNYKFLGGVSDRFFDNKFGARLQVSAENKQLPSERFGGSYGTPFNIFGSPTIPDSTLVTRTENSTLTDRQQERNRYGGSLILDFKTDLVDIRLYNLYNQKNDDVLNYGNTANFTSSDFGFTKLPAKYETKTETRTHSLQTLFKVWDTKLDLAFSYTKAEANTPGQQFPFLELMSGAFDGIRDLPYRQPSELLDSMGTGSSDNATMRQMVKYNTQLLDESYDYRLDWDVPYKISNDVSGIITFGGKYHAKDRTSDNFQEFLYLEYGEGAGKRQSLVDMFPWIDTDMSEQRGIDAKNFEDKNYSGGQIVDGRWQLGWRPDIDLLVDMQNQFYAKYSDSYNQDGRENYQQDYVTSEDLTAGYLLTEINIGSNLMIEPGIRYEKMKTSYQSYHIQLQGAAQNGLAGVPDTISYDRSNELWFPSLNMKYKINENLHLQGAVYKSAARPSFRQISPLLIYTEDHTMEGNNPFLQPSIALNFDIGVSLFSNDVGLFTVNLFYKEIDDLIFTMQNYVPFREDSLLGVTDDVRNRLLPKDYFNAEWLEGDQNAIVNFPMNNPNKAFIKGIELSWQTSLWYLPGLLSGIVLDLNLSLISSSTYYPYFQTVVTGYDNSGRIPVPINAELYSTRGGEVEDQPSAIYNAIIGWDYKGFSSRFSFRYQQTTLQRLDTKFSLRDSYYDNVLLIDISLKQELFENFGIFANITNINTHIDDYYITAPNDQLPTSQQLYGLRAQFGVSYNY